MHLKIALSNYCVSTCALSVCMGVFVCPGDSSGMCRELLSFIEKCVFTKKSEMFLLHKSFTKSKTGLAHDWKPWQSLPDTGQLNRKIKNLGEKMACCDSYQNQLSDKNDVSPEQEALLFFYRKTPLICSATSLLRFLSQNALLIKFKILTCKTRQRRWMWWAGDFQQ